MSGFLQKLTRALTALYRGSVRYWFGRAKLRSVRGWRLTYRLRVLMLLRSNETFRNLTPSREVRLWVDQEAFPRIFKLIKRAEHTIIIQMFIWRDDDIGRRMATELLRAADRGVRIDITKEAIGDVFELHNDFLTTKQTKEPLWQRFWTHPHIRIHYETHNDHAKVYIIDGRILLLTGMNIAIEYHEQLHDYLVELRGGRFVEKYLTHGEIQDERGRVQLKLNSDLHKEIRPVVMQLLSQARESIVIEHCYISDPDVIELLIKRSFEGVRVTIITPERTELLHHFTNMETMSELISRGHPKNLNVFLFPGVFHAKILLVDRVTAFVGSANLMQSSLDEMGEVNVLLHGGKQRAIIKLREVLRSDIFRSRLLKNPSKFRWIIRWLAWLKL
jgi:cardiolipin synthase